jgi:hypothetical protein
MATKLEQYAELQPFIQKDIRDLATQIYEEMAQKQKFNVSQVPLHRHNGKDAPYIPALNVEGFVPLPSSQNGVVNQNLLQGQIATQGDSTLTFSLRTTSNQQVFPIYPIVIISGGGSSTVLELTGGVSPGDVDATLNAPFGGTSGTYATAFDSTEIKLVTYVNGSADITWETPLLYAAGVDISLNGDSTFNGGEAPLGTMVIFCAELSMLPQIWIRANNGAGVEKWWGLTMDTGIIGFTE